MMHNTYNWIGHGSRFMEGGRGFDFNDFGPQPLLNISLIAILLVAAAIWTVGIKGYSLWTAAQRREKWWFIALLVINTFGLLEIIYLFFFAKKMNWKTGLAETGHEGAKAEGAHAHHHDHAHDGHHHKHEEIKVSEAEASELPKREGGDSK